jgi:hypothetical protein
MRRALAGTEQQAVLATNNFDITDLPVAGGITAHPFKEIGSH